MDIARLLNRDDSDQSDNETFEGADYALACQHRSVTLAPPPLRSSTPTPSSETSAMLAAFANRSVVTKPPPVASVTPAPLPKRGVAQAPTPDWSVTPTERAAVRARPSRPRKPTIASLRAQRDAFEYVVKRLPYVLRDLDDTSSSTPRANSTDGKENDLVSAGDHDAQRVCAFLKRTIVLTKQAQEEIAKRTEYLRLLKRHYEGTANLRKLMRGVQLDYWFWMCERWRDLALKYHEPISESKCYAIMQETIRAIENYKLPEGMKQNDAFGWCDSVRLDTDQSYVRFMTRKTLENADLKQVVDQTWSLNRDGDSYKGSHLGNNSELFHQTLQQISPDVMIVQRVEKYPELVQLTYSLSLIFRVQTESGYMIVTRCMESSRLQNLMKADGLSLCRSFFWETFDAARQGEGGECNAIQFTAAGSVGSDDPTYTKRWHNELLIALVRYEIQLMDTPILSLESIADDASDTTSAVHGS